MHTRRLILFALLLAVSAYATANYDIVVADNWNAFVWLHAAGNGSLEIGLPPDADSQERKLGMAKSSLAVCLRRLREKNIAKIDETGPTQGVRLTEWFRPL